jgi:hypothetical protein
MIFVLLMNFLMNYLLFLSRLSLLKYAFIRFSHFPMGSGDGGSGRGIDGSLAPAAIRSATWGDKRLICGMTASPSGFRCLKGLKSYLLYPFLRKRSTVFCSVEKAEHFPSFVKPH